MTVYLVHHGDAVGPEVDPQRPLSARGHATAARLAAECARRGVRPAAVWHSGKLRARQTAEYFWRACNPLASFTAVKGLQPADPPEGLRDRLAGEDADVLVAGHLPHLERLLRLLVAGDADAPGVTLPRHGVVALERTEDGRHVQRWTLPAPQEP